MCCPAQGADLCKLHYVVQTATWQALSAPEPCNTCWLNLVPGITNVIPGYRGLLLQGHSIRSPARAHFTHLCMASLPFIARPMLKLLKSSDAALQMDAGACPGI